MHKPTYTATPESSAAMAAIPKSTKFVSRRLGLASKVEDFPVMLAWAAMKTWLVVPSLVVSTHPNPVVSSSVVSALPSPVVPSLVVPSPVVSKVLPPSTVLPLMATTILYVWAAHNSPAPSEVEVTGTAPPEAAATATAPSEDAALVPLLVLLRPRRPSLNTLPALSWPWRLYLNSLPALSCSYSIY